MMLNKQHQNTRSLMAIVILLAVLMGCGNNTTTEDEHNDTAQDCTTLQELVDRFNQLDSATQKVEDTLKVDWSDPAKLSPSERAQAVEILRKQLDAQHKKTALAADVVDKVKDPGLKEALKSFVFMMKKANKLSAGTPEKYESGSWDDAPAREANGYLQNAYGALTSAVERTCPNIS